MWGDGDRLGLGAPRQACGHRVPRPDAGLRADHVDHALDRPAPGHLATRRRASRSTSSATMRCVTPPHRKQCAPPVSGHGEGRLPATGSTLPTPARRRVTGWWMRWTAHRPTSPTRSTIASKASTSSRYAGHSGAGSAAQRRQQPDRFGTTESACRDPAERPGRVAGYGHGVNLLQPERCSGILAI